MIVKCSEYGKEIKRQKPAKHSFCCNEHRQLHMALAIEKYEKRGDDISCPN